MESEQIALVVNAIAGEAGRIAEKPVTLVSATFDWMAPLNAGETATPSVTITRATRARFGAPRSPPSKGDRRRHAVALSKIPACAWPA